MSIVLYHFIFVKSSNHKNILTTKKVELVQDGKLVQRINPYRVVNTVCKKSFEGEKFLQFMKTTKVLTQNMKR